MKVYYFHATDGHSIPEISEGEFIKERDNYLTVRKGNIYEHFVINSFFRFFYEKKEAEEAWRSYACNTVMRLEELLRSAKQKQRNGPVISHE
jgi:hypothetical protein